MVQQQNNKKYQLSPLGKKIRNCILFGVIGILLFWFLHKFMSVFSILILTLSFVQFVSPLPFKYKVLICASMIGLAIKWSGLHVSLMLIAFPVTQIFCVILAVSFWLADLAEGKVAEFRPIEKWNKLLVSIGINQEKGDDTTSD